jgi:hypothetical protein
MPTDSLQRRDETAIGGALWEIERYIHALEDEVKFWRECARYETFMDGRPRFKDWNQSALDRCRRVFIEKIAPEQLK